MISIFINGIGWWICLLHVKTPDEALNIIKSTFSSGTMPLEHVQIRDALGRTIGEPVIAREYVPDFNRSTVDGFAVFARDTFGCSESIPAILPQGGEVMMGTAAIEPLEKGTCLCVPTGGDVPDGADAVVMLEYSEDYGDGTIGILKPVAPGDNMIFRGDDVSPGGIILPIGNIVSPHNIGALAASGISEIAVCKKPIVGIISTGDELVAYDEKPLKGQIRDVNTLMLEAVIDDTGGQTKSYGIIRDSEAGLQSAVAWAVSDCDIVLISGGSSVGMKDATARVIENTGRILFHGIAMKPGKPTILGVINQKPVFGLPGHPVAAYFVAQIFVHALMRHLMGCNDKQYPVIARLGEAVSSNHGRAEYIAVVLEPSGENVTAHPIHGKSGLITSLSGSDGYICIPRDCEGLPKGSAVSVMLWNR